MSTESKEAKIRLESLELDGICLACCDLAEGAICKKCGVKILKWKLKGAKP